ncbi:MAG: hypothetical protein A2X46_06750 [Lentisphaerae bacterium GWF2_57_35]|nr:MAG: hypothetical protein A2X46_06750 [Lentisphaerae bacterium GWF2_57_35]
MFIEMLFKPDQRFYYLSWVFIVAFSVCVHEFAHAWTASRLGDDTAARNGHLTLNPFVQMGTSSLIMLALFGIAWGAAPVDPSRLRSRGASALVSFAGPGSNLLLSLIFAGLAVGLGNIAAPAITGFFKLGSAANGVLFFFNMLPIPMFDGWSIFSLFVPAMRRVTMQQAQTFMWFFIMLVFMTRLGGFIWTAGYLVSGIMLLFWGGLLGM